MEAYDQREEELGEELMRYLERSILLDVIDNRWREHLFDMDYLREGIHLRGFAQIDPLVAYKNEGFSMFEELMHSIWEEFSKLIFHAQVEVDPSQLEGSFAGNGGGGGIALDYSGGTPDGAALGAAGGRRPAAPPSASAPPLPTATTSAPRRRWSRPWSRTSGSRTSAATTPAGVARAKSSRSATAPEGVSAAGPSELRAPIQSGVHPRLQRAGPRRVRRRPRPRGRAARDAGAAAWGRGGAAVGDAGRPAGSSRRSSSTTSTRRGPSPAAAPRWR